jgi:uncharacterized membrane protein SpoIIM required for sporulation
MEGACVDLDAYVSEHSAEWQKLRTLTRPGARLGAREIDEMLMLYRRTATHLSVIRSRNGDPMLVAQLSRLVLQARGAIAPPDRSTPRALLRFVFVLFPGEVYRSARWTFGVAAGLVLLTGTLVLLTANDLRIARGQLSADAIVSIVDTSVTKHYSIFPEQLIFHLGWSNSAILTALCLAGGVLVLPSLYILGQVAFAIGIPGGILVAYHRPGAFGLILVLHSLLELTCLSIAGGVGLRVAWAWISPPRGLTRSTSLGRAGRSGIVVAVGLAVPLLIGQLIEAFVMPAEISLAAKVIVAVGVWLSFVTYIVVCGWRAAGVPADVGVYERAATAASA